MSNVRVHGDRGAAVAAEMHRGAGRVFESGAGRRGARLRRRREAVRVLRDERRRRRASSASSVVRRRACSSRSSRGSAEGEVEYRLVITIVGGGRRLFYMKSSKGWARAAHSASSSRRRMRRERRRPSVETISKQSFASIAAHWQACTRRSTEGSHCSNASMYASNLSSLARFVWTSYAHSLSVILACATHAR